MREAGARLPPLKTVPVGAARAPKKLLAQRALTSVIGKLATLAVIAVAFFGALVGTIYLALRSPEVRVPEIVGKNVSEAESALADAGLGVRTRARRYSAEVKPDTVLDQTPRPGELIKAGQTVAVVLSRAEAREGESSVGVSREEDKKSDAEKAAVENANKPADENRNENRPKRTANANNKNKNANNQNAGGNVNQNVTANSNLNTNLVTNSTGAANTQPTPAPPQPTPAPPTRTETPTPPARNTNTATPREGNANAPAERPRTTSGRNTNTGNRNSAAPARNANRRPTNNQ